MLVDRHGSAVRTFLRRVCVDADEAEDLAQETFLTAWTTLRRLDTPEKFRSWVMGIAWRKSKMAARSAVRRRKREQDWRESEVQQQHQAAPERALALRQALAEIAPEPRAALALCLGAGLTHDEAAKALELPVGTVKSHIARGRQRLVALLGADDD